MPPTLGLYSEKSEEKEALFLPSKLRRISGLHFPHIDPPTYHDDASDRCRPIKVEVISSRLEVSAANTAYPVSAPVLTVYKRILLTMVFDCCLRPLRVTVPCAQSHKLTGRSFPFPRVYRV